MTKEEFKEYNNSRACTLKLFIKRHGKELGIEKWNHYCKIQKDVGCSEKYFVEKFGKENGLKRYKEINKLKALTCENYIRKYGKELGIEKYKKCIESHNPYYSKISQECFWKIYDKIKEHISNDKIYFAELNKEFGKFHKNKYYFYDFVITEPKICIEFHGNVFHANPEIFNENDTPNPFDKYLTSKEIWKIDKIKQDVIINEGFKYFIIWEKDYNYNQDKSIYIIIEKIKEVINEYIKT